MKKLKKLIISIMCCCLVMSGMAINAVAAEGSIMFSDPETAVGDMVDIKCAISATDTISGINLTLNYDSDSLRFESGDGVTKSQDGTLTYTGEGGSTEASFTMTFQALKEGSASVSVASSSVTASDGTEVTLDEGNAAVTIAAGDPSKIKSEESTTAASGDGVKIEINGKSYELSSNFADQDIPSGFKKATVKYEGADRTMVTNDSESIYLAYLIDPDGLGDFYYYDSSKAKFSMYEQVKISDEASIIVLNESDVSVPSTYETTTLTLNDKEFSIWQNPQESDYYVLYAIGPDGEKGFYRYDSKEGTYQRFEMPKETKSDSASTSKSKGIFGKLRNLIDHYFNAFIVIVGILLILLIIRLIVVRIKLRNRDLELDDLYDEYGIDLEDEEDEELLAPKKKKQDKKKKKAPKNGPAVRKPQKTAQFDFEEDYDDYGELDYEDEDDFEDIDSFSDDEYDYEDDEYEYDYDDDDYDDDDDLIDDLDELLSEQPKKRRSHMEEDDTFKVDFIDLD